MITGKPGMVVAAVRSRCTARHPASRILAFAAIAVTMLLTLVACGPGPAQKAPAEIPSRVELNQTPYNDVPLGGGGTGTVDYHGTIYHFTIGGLGVEGGAIAILQTLGEVYRLGDISSFPGTYRRATDAAAIAGQPSGGVWLQNQHAVILHLVAPQQGDMPDIGTDALRVDLNQ